MKLRRLDLPKAKPIRRDEYRRLPIPRVPMEGALTPSLRRRELTSAIGFHLARASQDEDSDG